MGVGDPLPLPPDKNQREDKPPDIASTSSSASAVSVVNARISDSPILLFVYFHKAFRAQLAELQCLAGDIVRSGSDLAVELRRKFDFLKLVYKYHSAAEDEVIFSALDTRVKNIAFNYSLEHDTSDDLFTSIFHWLHVLEEESGNIAGVLREVVLCIGTIQSSICQHMLKEERQVFPLLIENFSCQEQASLVWQFICSVPVMVLEDVFPWMTSLLSPIEKAEVVNCVKHVVPKELSLQLVINSWLTDDDNDSSFAVLTKIVKGVQSVEVSGNMKKSSSQEDSPSGLFQRFWQWSTMSFSSSPNTGHTLIHSIQLWHNAIKRDLLDIQKGLCLLKVPSLSLDLNVLVARLNFLADVLIFYGYAFKKFFYPMFEEMVDQHSSTSKQFTIDVHVENFKRSLDLETRTGGSASFVKTLQEKLESLILTVAKQFSLDETEVFPIISKNCNIEMQRQLLYRSLHVLPLGLLKCVIMWFSAQLPEDESQSIIHFLSTWEDSFPNRSFAHLLLQWFRFGYSGKTSVDRFWNELSFMFKPRSPPEEEHIEEASGSFPQQSQLLQLSKNKSLNCLQPMDSPAGYMNETPYSSAMNQQIFISGKLKPLQQLPDFFGDKNSIGEQLMMDLKPIDLIFLFHKAMKKDLDYLVSGSSRLAADYSFLGEFHQRFHLIKFLYQIHSDAEDEIAFPALEAKGKLQNISQSYSIDHELEVEHLEKVSFLLNEMAGLNSNVVDHMNEKYEKLCMSLQDVCKSIHKLLSEHLHREETELWGLFRNCFTIEEQEKIIACMLGRISGEILQDMIPWLMESLIPDEQHAVMSLWRQATRKTMFAEWLKEWYNSHHVVGEETEEANKDQTHEDSDPLDIVWKYLFEGAGDEDRKNICSKPLEVLETGFMNKPLGKDDLHNKVEVGNKDEISESKIICRGGAEERKYNEGTDNNCESGNSAHQAFQMPQKSNQSGQASKYECLLSMSQDDVEAIIRRISRDSALDPQKKSQIIQHLLMSRWIATQRINNFEPSILSSSREEVPGQHPSYRDPHKLIFGCKHYIRSCKLLAPCCNQLFTCIRCHDEEADHSVDRKHITKMMCMKCLIIQPVGARCSNTSCSLSMGKYYCKICKLFDDEREIYHCPYCNLCRVGKGLGIDYFHCMKCNACMSRLLVEHVCREKCLEDNCPICHEYIFTSNSPVKALPCGHVMHSTCFQEYTCSHYTCPICSKSLGDMQVYFRMLDALLAEQKMPDEYSNQTQVILCNDCGRKGNASYHWLYHKCSSCASYNTRLL